MNFKDYYELLELHPSASLADVKRAYRRLAMQYHPDKTDNDPYSNLRFRDIKEAYETLSNPSKKEYYLQQRWYDQHAGGRKGNDSLTPVDLLKRIIELEKYVARLDVYRMNKAGLFHFIAELMTAETIERLNSYKELNINDAIVSGIIACTRALPLKFILPLHERMHKIKTSEEIESKLRSDLLFHYRSYRWEKYKIWLLLSVVLILCVLLFFFSK